MTIDAKQLRTMRLATSPDGARFRVRQVLVEPSGVWVATDGHRMHRGLNLDLIHAGPDPLLIPRWALSAAIELCAESGAVLLEDMSFTTGRNTIRWVAPYSFVPYRHVFEQLKISHTLSTKATEVRGACKGVADVVVSEDGVAAVEHKGEYARENEVIVNASYLLDALKGQTDVTIGWGGPEDPLHVIGYHFDAVIMPKRHT